MSLLKLTPQQRWHMLAGLRALQRNLDSWHCIATNEGEVPLLNAEELDELCENLNVGALDVNFGGACRYFHEQQDPALEPYIQNAGQMNYVRGGEVEVDDYAIVSKGNGAGAYVLGWIWVDDETAGVKSPRAFVRARGDEFFLVDGDEEEILFDGQKMAWPDRDAAQAVADELLDDDGVEA